MSGELATRTVVIGVDSSDHSKKAFEWYMSNVYRPNDIVVITHIPEAPNLPTITFKHGVSPPVDEWAKLIQDRIEKIRKLETEYEATLIERRISYQIKIEQYKNPGEGIVTVADNLNAEIIVVGTRGLDVVRRTLLGSVSDYVVRHSRVPVLICPSM